MNVAAPLPSGFKATEPWPASGVPVEYRPSRSAEVLTRQGQGRSMFWALNPYSGCEFACTYCKVRSLPPFEGASYTDFERKIGMRTNAAEAVIQAMREEHFRGVPLVLGTTTDPWQPVERKANVTRSVLDALSRFDGVDLRAQTKSALAARDADVLAAISRRGKVAVGFSIGTQDFKLAKTLEPLAPTPDRRFTAMEALARAGVRVGILVSPVLPGLNDSTPALEGLLRRARDAGAKFASAAPLSLSAAERDRVVDYVARFNRDDAAKYDRLLSRTEEFEPGFTAKLRARFGELCLKYGLENAWEIEPGGPIAQPRVEKQSGSVETPAGKPRQLELFRG